MQTNTLKKIKDKEESLEKTYQKLLEVGFGDGPIEEAPKFMDENVMGYGTALDEKIMSYDEFRELIIVQRTQAANFDEFIYQSNPVTKRFFNEGNSALIVDEIDLTAIINGDKNTMNVRMSTMLEYRDDSWKIIHWHGSLAEHISEGEDPWHVNEWKQKTEMLEQMVEEKTAELSAINHELQIEASLERIRAVAMGMQKSEDLLSICEVSYHEFEKLGFNNLRAVLIHIHDDEKRSFTDYDYCDLFGGEISTLSYDSHPLVLEFLSQIKSADDAFAEAVISGGELESWKKVRIETGQKDDPRLNNAHALYYYGYSIGVGDFTISTLKPIDDTQREILKRFRNVFDLAYRRYNDIKRAEAQAREAQVEAALERVRSRTMAMQHSDELPEVANVLFLQVQSLGIPTWSAGYNILSKDKSSCTCIMSSEGQIQAPFHLPFDGERSFQEWYAAIERGDNFFIQELGGKQLEDHYEYLFSLPDIKQAVESLQEAGIPFPAYQVNHLSFFKQGFLLFITYAEVPDWHEIFKRFTTVFEQTYARFLDLQKAEAQAREAQTESALERVRSKAMAMNIPEDLTQTAEAFFSELVKLNIKTHRCGFGIVNKETRIADIHATSVTETKSLKIVTGQLKLYGHPVLDKIFEGYDNQQEYHPVLYGKEIAEYYEVMNPQVEFPDFKDDETQYGYYFYFKEGGVFAWTDKEFAENELEIFRRYTSVLSLTYRRYIDLKEAVAQAREAHIEAALERVRAKTMAMQKSEELKEVIQIVYEQFVQLNILVEHAGFIMDYKASDDMHIWLADKHEVPFQVNIPYFDSPHWNSFIDAKEKGKDFFVNHFAFEEKNKFYVELFKLFHVPEETKEYYFSCPGLAISTVLLENVGLYIENFSGIPYADEENNILMRFGKVFEQTYTRFLDLQKSEEQRKIIQAENDRKTEELEEARKLQLAMLPKELPKLSKLDIATYMQTATEVGGDYYDYSFKDNGSINICLGDATGHGLKAGTLVAMMKSLFINDSVKLDINKFFSSSNETLKKMSFSQMMMAFAMVNIYGQKIKIANAGIPPIYIYRKNKNEVEEVTVNGLPIGAMKNSKYEIYENEVAAGDTILMLSDGFPELQNASDEMYGYERLKSIFRQNGNKTSKEIITVLENESKTWSGKREQDDDVTFVVIKFK